MQITVTIPDELAALAQTRGVSLEAYVQSLIEEAGHKSLSSQRPRTTEQIEAFFVAMAEGSRNLPDLSTESFTRESFYQDRGWVTYLVDTNVLLRFVKPDDRDYPLVRFAVRRLWIAGDDLCYTSQNLGEFWNTCTRPSDRNGYGLSIPETDLRARLVEDQFTLLEDSKAVHRVWRNLLVAYSVSGVQVHDARLVAAMHVHQATHVLTFNTRDFVRYAGITPVHPQTIENHR
jgi:hypothetical protein